MRRAGLADVPQLTAIINHESIRPYIGGDGPIDPTELVADERNVWLFDDGGGQFFHWGSPGVFEAHSFYLVRGKEALERGREAIQRMFDEYGAVLICRATPLQNKPARWFNRKLGFRSSGTINVPHYGGDCELFELRKEDRPCH